MKLIAPPAEAVAWIAMIASVNIAEEPALNLTHSLVNYGRKDFHSRHDR